MSTTPPDQLCKWPHKWPCLGHMGVLRGIYPACDICEPHLERSREITGIKKTHEITATLTAAKELPASTANALGTMIQLASEQLARGDFHNQNHENTDTISELATDGRMGRDEPKTAGGGEATDNLLVEAELERRGIDWKSSFQKAHDTIDAHIQTQSL